jgi:hypothetical protein
MKFEDLIKYRSSLSVSVPMQSTQTLESSQRDPGATEGLPRMTYRFSSDLARIGTRNRTVS